MNDVPTTVAVPSLTLRRTYAAPRQRVFDAWTKPELLMKFLCTSEVRITEVTVDLRTGGSYKIVMLMSDGDRWNVGGVYRDVRPPERLSMTWRWDEDDPKDEYDTLLTLEFHEAAGGTELVLTHDRFATQQSRDNHNEGWAKIMAQLDSVLAQQSQ
jgi:uncharacterized protein YndB with AHSA1/START domain